MSAILVRNLSEEVHRALKARAASHNRSTEAEARAILTDAVEGREAGIGSLLIDIAQNAASIEIEYTRDRTPYEPLDFS